MNRKSQIPGFRSTRRGTRRAITLPELLVAVAIIVILIGIATMSFRALTDASGMTAAVNTLTSYAAVARAYAMEYQIETMLVVNPHNGRLELWHLNPPRGGGTFDELSSGDGTVPIPVNVNGYAFAPVLDSTAALPRDASGRPLVMVHPIDFAQEYAPGQFVRDRTDGQATRDNMNWAALCFDASGRLVTRVRRIATRMATDYSGAAVANPNRRPDGTPDVAKLTPQTYVVDRYDSLISSTTGFVVSDRVQFEKLFPTTAQQSPFNVLAVWLPESGTLGAQYREFKRKIAFNQWSGRELAAAE
jgi:prepilin-type N-terminal cleavage/methylation domain-containing protein